MSDNPLDPLNPLLASDRGKRLPALADVGGPLIADVAGVGMFSPETMDRLLAADSSGRVAAELNQRLERLCQTVRETKEHAADHPSYNMARGLFPVHMDGVVVACLDTGPLKIGPFTPEQAKDLAKSAGVPLKTLGDLDRVPHLSAKQFGGVFTLYKSMALGFSHALNASDANESPVASVSSASLAADLSRHYHKILSVILGYTSCAIGRDDVPDDIAASLGHVQSAAVEGKELAEQLFSVGPEGEVAEPYSLHGAVESILPLLDAHRSVSVELAVELNAASDVVRATRSELHQLVFNLLSVAMDIAPLESCITLRTENNPKGASGGTHVNVRVFDAKGQPFDELAPQLTMGLSAFGPLADHEVEHRLSGMVRRVEAMGGTIRIKPQPGRMTSIECSLPVSASALAPSPAEGVPRRSGHLIWVVGEDEIGFTAVCGEMLRHAGHQVETFVGAESVWARWESGDWPDLVVGDYNLGEMDGGELRTRFAGAEHGSGTPFILVSSLPSVHPGIEDALALSRTHYLAKPVGERELNETVGLALGLTLADG